MDKSKLLSNLNKLHTTELGTERIKRNLSLNAEDVIDWCKERILDTNAAISRKGKNWYVTIDNYVITINCNSYTIITAHASKNKIRIDVDKRSRKDIIFEFVNSINKQNTPLIIEMMADDFIFIDTYGDKSDKEHMKTGWPGYFNWFPDYKIEINEYLESKHCSVILGKACGSYMGNKERHWEFPAAWKVAVSKNKIRIWQVFCDSKKQLDSMN